MQPRYLHTTYSLFLLPPYYRELVCDHIVICLIINTLTASGLHYFPLKHNLIKLKFSVVVLFIIYLFKYMK